MGSDPAVVVCAHSYTGFVYSVAFSIAHRLLTVKRSFTGEAVRLQRSVCLQHDSAFIYSAQHVSFTARSALVYSETFVYSVALSTARSAFYYSAQYACPVDQAENTFYLVDCTGFYRSVYHVQVRGAMRINS
jgi:hypothetical protein